jgi:hypothetical protein
MSQKLKQKYADITSIQLHKKTHSDLLKIGAKGQTFDQIINKLLSQNQTKTLGEEF